MFWMHNKAAAGSSSKWVPRVEDAESVADLPDADSTAVLTICCRRAPEYPHLVGLAEALASDTRPVTRLIPAPRAASEGLPWDSYPERLRRAVESGLEFIRNRLAQRPASMEPNVESSDDSPEDEPTAMTVPRLREFKARWEHYTDVRRVMRRLSSSWEAHEQEKLDKVNEDLLDLEEVLLGEAPFMAGEKVKRSWTDDAKEVIRLQGKCTEVQKLTTDLAMAHPEQVLGNIDVFERRKVVTNNLVQRYVETCDRHKDALTPAARQSMQGVLDDMRREIALAEAETKTQGSMLETLGAACLGVGQAQLDGGLFLRESLAAAMGTPCGWQTIVAVAPLEVAMFAGLLGQSLRIDYPAPSEQVVHALNAALGRFFKAKPQGFRSFTLEPRPDVEGHLSMNAFRQELGNALSWVDEKHDLNVAHEATKLAVEHNPDFEMVGQQRVMLSRAAEVRLAALPAPAPPSASARVSPAERLIAVGVRAKRETAMAEFKGSLHESFNDRVLAQEQNAHPLRRPVAREKAKLLRSTMDEVIGSPNREQMLQVIDGAQIKHEYLVKKSWFPASRGETGEILDDLRGAVARSSV